MQAKRIEVPAELPVTIQPKMATQVGFGALLYLCITEIISSGVGGYLAGRLRSPLFDGAVGERTFRDAAQGFMVWAIGVFATVSIAGLIGRAIQSIHEETSVSKLFL